jgi:hypothetical protein
MKGGMMKKRLLGFLALAALCFVTCGNEPPEDFYTGTPEDDEKINDILNNDYPILLLTEDQFINEYFDATFPAVTFSETDSFLRVDSPLVKVLVDSLRDEMLDLRRFTDLWYAKDTTCTVRLFDTFDVRGGMKVATRYTAHFDIPVIDSASGDTTGWRIGTTDIDNTPTDDYQDYACEGLRFIFLEPERQGGSIVEPFQWILKRISYGMFYFPYQGADIPLIDNIMLTAPNGDVDTIVDANNDSLFTGHAMNRLKSIDSLIDFDDSTQVDVQITLTAGGTITTDQCVFFASSGVNWVQLPNGNGSLTITGSGITNLYFKVVTRDSYYYYFPNRGYFGIAWLIPVSIN